MSGITGIFRRDGKDVDPADIKKMNDKISHRGPDGSRIWFERPVAFGHQMLHTTPESLQETLPFEDKESRLVITADARIDNRKELAPELGIEDKEHVSDSYFILKAYEKWGEKCPEELLGDFAFAIWDKNKEQLFCARDHMGVKPFYYYLSESFFIFSSEMKAILSILKINPHLNQMTIANFLALINGEDRELTIYNDIFRLPAAYWLSLFLNGKTINQYWSLNPDFKIRFDNDEEYERCFLDIFNDSVSSRMRTSFPMGSMLSGGLDSSSVTCTAKKISQNEGRNKFYTFSAYFDSIPQSNERYFIEKVLSCHDFDHHYIRADKISPLGELDVFFSVTDHPFIVPNTFMIWNIIREAHLNNVRVVLDGFEGDATLSHGKGYLIDLLRAKRLNKFFSEINSSKKLEKSLYGLIVNLICDLLPLFIKKRLKLWTELKGDGFNTKIITKDFSNECQIVKRVMDIYENNEKARSAQEKHYQILNSGLLQFELELLDSLSASFSVELRHPFFDKRMVEFCLAIPTEQKISNGWDRFIMRRAMADCLPKEVQWRKNKGNLAFNFKKRLMEEHLLLNEIIFKENYMIKDYINLEKIKTIYGKCVSGDTKDTLYIWNTLSLCLWLKNYVD